MQHRTIGDLMTWPVVHVRTDATFKAVAATLAHNDVTAVPVVDDVGRPIGVVSEADLVRRVAQRPDPAGPTRLPEPTDRSAGENVTVEELMTAPAVCARPEWTVVEAARIMVAEGVKRLPVVDEAERLVGIVSRGDLLRVFLRRDDSLREEISRDVLVRTLGLAPADMTVEVDEGQVTIEGLLDDAQLVPVVERLCLGVDGVVSVDMHVSGRGDRTGSGGTRG
ncbi:CBS domain-containing protein [Streptomyces coelicoflavus]|uniref:CBS domain-containing protein n=1 Tax=Streptomyces coelicoflavus TaxID=285562 RepID=UPI00368AB462